MSSPDYNYSINYLTSWQPFRPDGIFFLKEGGHVKKWLSDRGGHPKIIGEKSGLQEMF